ncbi:DM13 domain-containing protein [Streptomyces sp. SID7499]|uniref:DM13 domain-containing protein n=1 Tax=Streptomyces sp. SID7499 TaxID=2706086 RepID=A0A6G3XWI8_9ACTN|nr:DM13 domain-containing protein [Streptomyces sp. SID7499]
MGRARKTRGRPWVIGVLVAALACVGLGLYWFQPWKLWQDETVQEALPSAVAPAAPPAGAPSESPSPAPRLRTLAGGELISHEHATSGKVKLVRLADGSHVVRLEDLDTSNGPDLRVWLTDAPVKEGRAGWRVFDDGAYVSLGKLKGNKGSQNYTVPADVDPSRFTSVSIWCDRFDVSFGAAELART